MDNDKVLLATYKRTDVQSILGLTRSRVPQGSMWDYHKQQWDLAWIASSQEVTAVRVQDWLQQMTKDRWYGAHYVIVNPDSA